MVSSSGDGVWPTRGAEASGLKCGRKRAADRGEDGKRLRRRSGGGVTARKWGIQDERRRSRAIKQRKGIREWTLVTS